MTARRGGSIVGPRANTQLPECVLSNRKIIRPPLVEVYDAVARLTLAEAAEVVKALERDLGVSATPLVSRDRHEGDPVGGTCNPPGLGDPVQWRIEGLGPARREVILTLRRITGLSLAALLEAERHAGVWRSAPFDWGAAMQLRAALPALGASVSFREPL